MTVQNKLASLGYQTRGKPSFYIENYFRKEAEIMKMFLFCYVEFLDDSIANEFERAGYKSHMKFHSATGQDVPNDARHGSIRFPGKVKVWWGI